MNCQIVCCPGLNDGAELHRTLSDLYRLMPNISSLAVVPVGLSKYREGLYPLTPFDKETASAAIDIIEKFQKQAYEEYGRRTFFPSDELYLLAERDIPSAENYEEYPQYENGVGMLRSLIDEFSSALEDAEWEGGERHVSIATGYLAYDTLKKLAEMAEKRFPELKCSVCRIRNDFFGDTITVTGLITARDLIAQLSDKSLGSELLISSSMLRSCSEVFLDDLTVNDVEESLKTVVRAVGNDGYELLDAIMGTGC